MLEEFKKYVSNYNLDDKKINLKYNHCLRVMKLNRKYAKLLGFSKEDIELATLIGLLHDIGRFEQIKQYGSFDDLKTIDHADYSVEQLFENDLIKEFWKNEDDYELIKFAIKNHNKISIPKTNDERMLKHAKLIRDVDKIDIFYLLGVLDELKLRATDDKISYKIKKDIFNHQCCNTRDVKNHNDKIALNLAFLFDINYDICLKELKKYFKAFYDVVGKKDIFKNIVDEIDNYIDERMIAC